MKDGGYYLRRPTGQLRVEAGRAIVDDGGRVVLVGTRQETDYLPSEGTYKAGLAPAPTDDLVHELVRRYNVHPILLDAVRTIMREVAPQSSAGFIRAVDLPRIYFHLQKLLKDAGMPSDNPGKPATLEPPEPPPSTGSGDAWTEGWLAGYKAAWGSKE